MHGRAHSLLIGEAQDDPLSGEGLGADGSSVPRFLVLEDTDRLRDHEPRAVLCEWMADGSRRNHERHIVPDRRTFTALVDDCLRREADRRSAGARSIAVGAWNPGLGESPTERLFRRGGFRAHLCLFAFQTFPNRVFADQLLPSLAADERQAREVLAELWREAGTECQRREQPELPFPAGLRMEVTGEPTPGFLLVRMPTPLSPPEPYYAAVPLGHPRKHRVYTLERAAEEDGAPVILGRLDQGGMHAIIGHLGGDELPVFLRAVSQLESGERPALVDTGDSFLEHLTLYAMLSPKREPPLEAAEEA